MGKIVTIKSLFDNFKKESKIEEKTAKYAIDRVEEGFHAGVVMLLESMREEISEMSEDDAIKTFSLMEMEAVDFFDNKVQEREKKEKENHGKVFDDAMLQIAGEKFEFLIGAIDPCDKVLGTYTLVKKTENGFEVVLANTTRDPEKFKNEVRMLSELFEARVVKSY